MPRKIKCPYPYRATRRAVSGYVIVNDKTGRMIVNRYDDGDIATFFFTHRMALRFCDDGERPARIGITSIE